MATPVTPLHEIALPGSLCRREDGTILIRGHRISLHVFAEEYFNETGPEAERFVRLARRFPTIERETLVELAKFCDENEASVRHYVAEQQRITHDLRARGTKAPSLEELRRRRP